MTTSSRSAWWVVLMVLVVLPVPFNGIPIPERGAPISYIACLGALAIFCWIGRSASWPLATLLGYTFVRILWAGVPLRGVQLVLLLMLAGALYVEAVGLSSRQARMVAWALVGAVGFQALLGLINVAFRIYPSPYFLVPPLHWLGVPITQGSATLLKEFVGRPMGWLTHPNFWGAYMALAIPVVYALLGRWVALLAFGLAALSGNIGPVVSGGVGLLIMSWRDLGRQGRPLVVLALLVVILGVGIQHVVRPSNHGDTELSTLTSGRSTVWAASWPNLEQHWFVGNGVGSWRYWAEAYNQQYQQAVKNPGMIPATLQAHNEAWQLWFELGLVGLLIGLWWLNDLAHGTALLLSERPAELMWVGVVAVAIVNSFGSPTFHFPQQAVVALFGAARLDAARREYA